MWGAQCECSATNHKPALFVARKGRPSSHPLDELSRKKEISHIFATSSRDDGCACISSEEFSM
jgi:hypothetical protein